MRPRNLQILVAAGLAAAICHFSPAQGQAPAVSPLGQTLRTVFSPLRSPNAKSMGLRQRTFLDVLEESNEELEIVLVVDGTESMEEEIEGVKQSMAQMVDDLRRYKGDNVRFALVIYRDEGSPSSPIVKATAGFTGDVDVLMGQINAIKTEPGAPFFEELIDLGVYQALAELPWTEGAGVSRWLLVFGDAPPFPSGHIDEKNNARRHYETDKLVELAGRKGVTINCILCTSREKDRKVYEELLPKTDEFMGTLARRTGGVMLNLSYPDIRQSIAEADALPTVPFAEIDRITEADLEAARGRATADRRDIVETARVNIAVLPHMPLADMRFDTGREEVLFAAELRHKLDVIPRVQVKSLIDVEREFSGLADEELSDEQRLRALALRLRVDYVIWGTMSRAGERVTVESGVYSQADGRPRAHAGVATGSELTNEKLAGALLLKLVTTGVNAQTDASLAYAFDRVRKSPDMQREILSLLSSDPQARRELLEGFELLERALSFPAGDERSKKSLDDSAEKLKTALRIDDGNPLAEMMLADCNYNLAQWNMRRGKMDEAAASMKEYERLLSAAFRDRERARDEHSKLEIAADYALLKGDAETAIANYRQLTQAPPGTPLRSVLRAHWNLAGIYAGDWGAPESVKDLDAARDNLVQVMAHWPDSPQAQLANNVLRWNPGARETEHNHLPLMNQPLVATLDGDE